MVCSPRSKMQQRVILRENEHKHIVVESLGYLGGSFDKFKRSVAGARFNWDRKEWAAENIEVAMRIAAKLRDAGFAVVMTPWVREQIEGEAVATKKSVLGAVERLREVEKQLAARGKFLFEFQRQDVLWLSSRKRSINCNEQGLGKAQPVDELVPTPTGLCPIGFLRKGSFVFGSDGRPTRVTGVYRRGKKKIFRVRFSDGTSTECCDEHLWQVRLLGSKPRVLPLSEIKKNLRNKTNWRYYIPMMSAPAEFEAQEVPLDPYLVGVLIGDGGIKHSVRLSSQDQEILDSVSGSLPDGVWLRKEAGLTGCDYRITCGVAGGNNPVTNVLRDLGLFGHGSHEKFVPSQYKFNTAEVRLSVLRGLMDTDGFVSSDGITVEFYSTSERLADDVCFLVHSLGGTVSKKLKKTTHKDCHRISVKLPPDINPFRLSRKRLRVRPKSKYKPARMIVGVDEIGEKQAVCISVAAEDSLYLTTKNFIVTHNTVEALAALPVANECGAIVVGPAIAKGVWKRETAAWRPDFAVDVLEGRKSFRMPRRGEMVVLNYDILPDSRVATALMSRARDHEVCLVGDEAHMLKSYKSERHKKFAALAEKADRVMLLTGTPLPNKPPELWTLLQLAGVALETFGSYREFVRLFSGKKLPFGGYEWGDPLPECGDRLKTTLVRHTKQEVLKDLPAKTYQVIDVDVSAASRKVLDSELEALGPTFLGAKDVSEIPFHMLSRSREVLARCKLDAVEEFVEGFEDSGTPIIVFGAHRAVVDELGKRPGWASITGDTKDRSKIEESFQRGELKGLSATIQAAGTALTLTRAWNVLFVDRSYTPADNEQAEDRANRIGQTNGVNIYDMVADHVIDKRVFEITTLKRRRIDHSVERAREFKEISDETLAALVPDAPPPPVDARGNPRRLAKNQSEEAAKGIVMEIAGLTLPKRQGVGFQQSDKSVGRGVAIELLATGRLTEMQWKIALLLGRKYASVLGVPKP